VPPVRTPAPGGSEPYRRARAPMPLSKSSERTAHTHQSGADPVTVLRVLALPLVAVSVGLDNFGASTAMGVSGVDKKLRIRVALIFGVFEAAMPIAGLLLGHSVAEDLGGAAKPFAGGLLGAVGAYAIVAAVIGDKEDAKVREPTLKRLAILGAALSLDNLVIGFALGAYHISLVVAALTIGAVSVLLSLLGLEIGRHLGERLGRRSELVGGAVLLLVGVAIGTGVIQ
jgi:manganese efflux pump family protein